MHSPLVYTLVDVGLRKQLPKGKLQSLYKNEAGAVWDSTDLLERIAEHFQFSEIKNWAQKLAFSNFKNGNTERDTSFDTFFDFSANSPKDVLNFFQKNASIFREQDALCMGNMHQSKESLASWKTLQDQPQVTLSLDFYSVGILFFSKKIKERQHFILRS